ncbi:MAG: hypothetical protein V2I54_11555 [Bacteroidales bacterium]|jgi:hypothetical protein|nr:hypothetical protein [Bacteroidales bacterium]
MNYSKHRTILWITLFALSMGVFEGSIVVYLRALYYPEGFAFPLQPMDHHIALTELVRELASLLMLLSVAILAGRNLSQRFGWFLYTFAVWDIVYYIHLWLFLGWPESLLTWDILFLLPVAWTGPVITPVIISALMITLSLIIYNFNLKSGNKTKINRKEWILLIAGASIVFLSFIWDYCRFLIRNLPQEELHQKSLRDQLFDLSAQYIPVQFPWGIFLLGVLVLIFSFWRFYRRNKVIPNTSQKKAANSY